MTNALEVLGPTVVYKHRLFILCPPFAFLSFSPLFLFSIFKMALYKTYGILTTIQSASAVAFSSFAVIHGTQIALANVGGPDMTNRWLLLGRPFYQDEHTEGLIVTGAVTVHVVSGLAKAVIREYWNGQRKKHVKNNKDEGDDDTTVSVNNNANNGLLTYHNATGYFLIPLVWIHYRLVRELPVKVFGDSAMLDVGIVAWGLQNWPIFSYTVHGALVGATAYHIISGGATAYRRTFTKKRKGNSSSSTKSNNVTTTKKYSNKKTIVVATTSIVLISGLIIIGRCTKKIPLRNEYASIYSLIFSSK
ncbi:hypothetical protein BDA99DRAFT_494837 [Phascolomyces articulosus]|uniref:Mitochondrial adapter protein MCP1 transmembrane domain-containing protein n=1 Tax=Phascolomyces articulosus TaxID=60185 RepID=A0AAD5KAX5_9FUNG|nr:hypothetical protein BDA99DRAFT_494837 [Phascolomyces articulosus]